MYIRANVPITLGNNRGTLPLRFNSRSPFHRARCRPLTTARPEAVPWAVAAPRFASKGRELQPRIKVVRCLFDLPATTGELFRAFATYNTEGHRIHGESAQFVQVTATAALTNTVHMVLHSAGAGEDARNKSCGMTRIVKFVSRVFVEKYSRDS